MKLKFLTLSALLVSSSGCSIFSADPPACDSNDTRDIIKEIMSRENDSPHFGTGYCIVEMSGENIFLGKANDESVCPELKGKVLGAKIESHIRSLGIAAAMYDYSGAIAQARSLKAKYFDDLETSFKSFLVKEEKESEDGNSVSCELKFSLETVSDKGGLNQVDEQGLYLKMYKKDDNGDREYNYVLK